MVEILTQSILVPFGGREVELSLPSSWKVMDDLARPTPSHLFFGDLLDYLKEHGAGPGYTSFRTAE